MKLKTQQSKRFTIYALCFIFLIFGFYASAAVEYQLIQPLPGIKTVSSFPDYIQKLIPFVLSLAAVLAVVMIVVGGIEYAVSEAVSSKAEAKDRIMQAIWGLLLALISYLILYTINPDLTSLKLDPNPAGTTQTPTDLFGGSNAEKVVGEGKWQIVLSDPANPNAQPRVVGGPFPDKATCESRRGNSQNTSCTTLGFEKRSSPVTGGDIIFPQGTQGTIKQN